MVIKFFGLQLHFLLAVSLYYSHLARHYQRGPTSSASLNSMPPYGMQRIFVLPKNITDPDDLDHDVELDVLYAPVSRHSVASELQDQAIEAWIPRGAAASQCSHSSSTMTSELRNHPHHHQRRHHRHHGSRYRSCSLSSQTGTIKLELIPDEGLFPGYVDRDQKACWWRMLFLLLSDVSFIIFLPGCFHWLFSHVKWYLILVEYLYLSFAIG